MKIFQNMISFLIKMQLYAIGYCYRFETEMKWYDITWGYNGNIIVCWWKLPSTKDLLDGP